MPIKQESGFTLLELLLVLSITMILAVFGYMELKPYQEKRQLDSFMEQLEKDVLYAQMYAMANGERTTILFTPTFYQVSGQEIQLERHFDEKIQITFRNQLMGNKVEFNENGNIRRFGRVDISYGAARYTYTIVFQIGKGRFYYE